MRVLALLAVLSFSACGEGECYSPYGVDVCEGLTWVCPAKADAGLGLGWSDGGTVVADPSECELQ